MPLKDRCLCSEKKKKKKKKCEAQHTYSGRKNTRYLGMLSSLSCSKLQMIFESELATAWEETGTEGMQFFIIYGRPFHISSKTNNETRRNGFQLLFFSVQSRYVCVSVYCNGAGCVPGKSNEPRCSPRSDRRLARRKMIAHAFNS